MADKLCKGIFWIKNLDEPGDGTVVFRTPCDPNGNTIYDPSVPYSSADGRSFNHKVSWRTLPKSLTAGKPFDWYPRGRTELRNGVAYLYCNPILCTDALKTWATEMFGLTEQNGVKEIRLMPDHSNHYRCAIG